MIWPKVSVIVVSRDRPQELERCLISLTQLDYPAFEVIVVANTGSQAGLSKFTDTVRLVPFEHPNISAARNIGAAHAACDIVAFIDDDAVAVPGWLKHLVAPMIGTDVAVCGGFVIGRNGFEYQWRAREIHADGQCTDLPVAGHDPFVPVGCVPKTEGTNMAARRDILDSIGFDEAYQFYLDETDFNMRVAQAGHQTALVPRAIVHHGFAASDRRTANRVPKDLSQIAASVAVFQRKFDHPDPGPERDRQRKRLLRLMVAGDILPTDVGRLLATFDQGWVDGMTRPLDQRPGHARTGEFLPFPTTTQGDAIIIDRFWRADAAMRAAEKRLAAGERVTVYLFALTARRHTLRFVTPGIWLQQGGQFGRSVRRGKKVSFWRARARAAFETQRRKQVWTAD